MHKLKSNIKSAIKKEKTSNKETTALEKELSTLRNNEYLINFAKSNFNKLKCSQVRKKEYLMPRRVHKCKNAKIQQ